MSNSNIKPNIARFSVSDVFSYLRLKPSHIRVNYRSIPNPLTMLKPYSDFVFNN